MSDILIRGMEMPKENDYTIAIVYGDGVVTEYHEDYWIRGADGEKQLGIAVPVQPHGRLIDADANLAVMKRVLDAPYTSHGIIETAMIKACIKMFEEAPSIIEAEEGET